MSIAFDHTIYLVADADGLDGAVARFERLGFAITARLDSDRENAATAQRLVCFDDGSYIEILAIRDAAARARHRFANFLAKGDGWVDYSLVTDRLDDFRHRLGAANIPVSGVHEHTRKLENGKPWGVRLFLAGIGAGHPALPFFLEDTVGRDLRVPRNHTRHPNGVTGTAGVTVGVSGLSSVASQCTILFGEGAPLRDRAAGVSAGLRFHAGSQWIDLIEAATEGLVSVTFSRAGDAAGFSLNSAEIAKAG
jgi:hypothetical protein